MNRPMFEILEYFNDLVKSSRGKARKAFGVRRIFGYAAATKGGGATQQMDFLRGRHD